MKAKRTPVQTRRLKEQAWDMAAETTLSRREIGRRLNVPFGTIQRWCEGIERPSAVLVRLTAPENRSLNFKLWKEGIPREERLAILAREAA